MLACAVALAACGRHPAEAPPPRPVVAAAVHPASGAATLSYPGQVAARFSTSASFRVAGKIVERRVHIGDHVKPGDVLARLDPSDFDKNVASAAAQLDAAEHRYTYAKQQLDRDTAQAKADLIAQAQFEQTQDNYASADAQRRQAADQLALAQNQRRYATLTADHAGTIAEESADTGQNVQSGQTVYVISWSGDVDVLSDLPEAALGAVRRGGNASVTLPALPGRHYAAHVRELADAADAQSHTWRVKLTLEQPDADVKPGMSANVSFATAAPAAGGAYTVPATALFHDGNAPALWIVHAPDDVLQLRRVEVAHYGATTVTVTSGLADGDRVVLQGVHTVTAGEKVRPVPPLDAEDIAP